MFRRSFSVASEPGRVVTPNLGPVETRFFMVPVEVWDGTRFGDTNPYLWDTGADFCMVDRRFAAAHNFRLHDENDRLEQAVGGVGGDVPGWLTTRPIRFPLLPGRKPLTFKFHFLVLDRPLDFPILGVRDVLLNFVVQTAWERATFRLRSDHDGE